MFRRKFYIFGTVASLLLFVFIPYSAHAEGVLTDALRDALVGIVQFLVADIYVPLIGRLLMLVTSMVISVAGYNAFAGATAVTVGWVLMRDIANMVLVVALVMQAFGTMLNVEALGSVKQLPRLVILAIVINFSKTITMFIIDIGQVVTMTFVAAFQSSAAGNFVKAFGLQDWLILNSNTSIEEGGLEIVGVVLMGYVLAAILITVALAVLVVMLGYFVMRIAMLWVLIILSPLAFGLAALAKKGESYYAKWWEELTKTIIVGPILAFFLWITLLTAGIANGGLGGEILNNSQLLINQESSQQGSIQSQALQTKAFTPEVLLTFTTTILMLLLGLKLADEMGGYALGAGKALKEKSFGYGKALGKWGLKKTGQAAWWGTKKAGKAMYNMPVTRGGSSLAGYVAGAGAKIKESGFGKAVGLNKEYSELVHAENKAKGLRAFGKEAQARQLEQGVISEHRKKLDPLTSDQLEAKVKKLEASGQQGGLEYRAVGLELANKGFFNTNHANLDRVAGKSADPAFKQDLIAAANLKGANYVEVKAGANVMDAVGTMMSKKSRGDLQGMFANIDDMVRKTHDMDGNEVIGDQYAVEKLRNLGKDDYDRMSSGTQEKIRNALLLAMRNQKVGPDGDDARNQLLEKLNVFDGVSGTPTAHTFSNPALGEIGGTFANTQNTQYQKQQEKLNASYAANVRKETGNITSYDEGLNDVSSDLAPADKANLNTLIANMQGFNVRPGTETDVTEVEDVIALLPTIFNTQQTNRTDAAGNDLNAGELFEGGTLRANLEQMREALTRRAGMVAGSPEQASIDKEIEQIQNTINALTQDLRAGKRVAQSKSFSIPTGFRKTGGQKLEQALKAIKAIDIQMKAAFASARQPAQIEVKKKRMDSASARLNDAVAQLLKTTALPPAVFSQMRTLEKNIATNKAAINAARNGAEVSVALTQLENLNRELERLRKSIQA